jgi:2-polyprenyl-6-methoxyphenol hydroxylase-like FAD-dependent oxidoreductase
MKCAIIGGGIGGLTLAAALHRHGIDAVVYDAAPELRAVGAGIWVPANAMQVLDRLGFAAAVADEGAPLGRAEVHDTDGGLLQAVDIGEVARRFGFGTVAILRARLQQILAAPLSPDTLRLGHACVHVESSADGARVEFENGTSAECDVVVAADGLRSPIRSQLFPASALRYAGQTSWRGLAAYTLAEGLRGVGRGTWGAGVRFGFSTVSPEQVYWFAVQNAPAGEDDGPDGALHHLQRHFAGFPAPSAELLSRTEPDAITRTDIYDLRPLPRWSQGRVVLIGLPRTPRRPTWARVVRRPSRTPSCSLAVSAMRAATTPEHSRRSRRSGARGSSTWSGRPGYSASWPKSPIPSGAASATC